MSHPIPQPPGIPLLGNIFDISPTDTWTSLKTLAERHGEIFQVKILNRTIVFVASIALADQVCDERRFRKFVGGPVVEIRAAVHDALFTAYDHEPSWGVAHRIMAPRLSDGDALRHQVFMDMRTTAEELLAKWKRTGEHVAAPLADLQRLNLEATTLALYGKKLGCLEGPEHPVLGAMEHVTAEAMLRPTRPAVLNLLYRSRFRAAIKTLRGYAREIVDHRREHPTDRRDVLAAMLENEDPETGTKLTDAQVLDEIVSMPIGSSTAPCLLATALFFLAKNPAVVRRAREEMDAVVVPRNRDMTMHDVDELPYVRAVVRESLRLSFAAPGFNREPIPQEGASKAPVQLAGGKYQMAHNQAIIVVMAGVNRDPAVFEEPLAFRPERMMGEQWERLPPAAKKWFGTGKRACIGEQYAWQWSVLVLAMLVRAVDFELADEGYELVQDGWFNYRPVGLKMRVRETSDVDGQ